MRGWIAVVSGVLGLAPSSLEASSKVRIAHFKAEGAEPLAASAEAELQKALKVAFGDRADIEVETSPETYGVEFVSEVVLAQKSAAGIDMLLTGQLSLKAPRVIELRVAAWRTSPPERLTTTGSFGPEMTLAAIVKKIASDLEIAVELHSAPEPIATQPQGPAPVLAGPMPPPPPLVVAETTNPVAKWSLIGGGAMVGVGVVLGIVSQVAFNGPLRDGTVRDRADNDSLIGSGQTTAAIADVGLIGGVVIAAFGAVALFTDLGAVEVAP